MNIAIGLFVSTRSAAAALGATLLFACIACSSGTAPSSDTPPLNPLGETVDGAAPEPDASTPAPMKPIVASKLLGELTAAGLDPSKLPALNELTDAQRKAVMKSFTEALGVKCTACHQKDFKVMTPQKYIAEKMWDEFVRKLSMNGSALYCDSCHQGSATFLDRSDKKALGAFMKENFVVKLTRKDGAEHSCATCHGDPFNGEILSGWAKGN